MKKTNEVTTILLSHPIDINLQDFILNGKFDYIKIGQTKEWITTNFPDPDSINNMGHNLFIWTYGNIEFHFNADRLFLIWCDNFHSFSAGQNIRLDKWIFEDTQHLTLQSMTDILHRHKVDFSVTHQPKWQTTVIQITKSHVELFFGPSASQQEPPAYSFHGFGLKK
ncbi:hypothetical protein [Listeria costaricensis]|uniref:hypothetical protein n=1 Tax=Listeria costaricensis TaxID=2026604 RepID=UPI0013C524D8|nr:hypothetical protein [Listeria costaricensis]